ncbi:hypothetical protein niasHT_035692 [Heterodera trifolii]|uniref:PPPDE domain-containing protein n=1 Tax=Heterodera trifolii TaxID=157864 RepID=A0ABD2I3G3_9BILA
MALRPPFPLFSNVQLFLLIFLAVVVLHLAQLQPVTEQNEEQPQKGEHRLRHNISLPTMTNSDASENDDLEETAEWIYEGKESAERKASAEVEETVKDQMSFKMANEGRGTSGEWAIEAERQMQIEQQQGGKAAENESSQSAAGKEKITLGKLFECADNADKAEEADEVKRALEEVELDWREKVDEKRRRKMEKDFRRMEKERAELQRKAGAVQPEQLSGAERRKLYGPQFDAAKFKADVEAEKPCDGEPLQVAEYYLFRWSSKLGIYHAGLFICGIEIHFHHPGIEFWKPMEYSTRFVGGMHRNYRPISYGGKEIYTQKTFRQIVSVINNLKTIFNPSTYKLLSRNCLLFLRTLVRQLTGLTNGEQIEWPWSAIHPLKKPQFALKQLKRLDFKKMWSFP